MLHASRLVSAESPKTPERLWEWEKVHVGRLLWNATAFGRELTHRYFPTWDALVQENERIWKAYYMQRPPYEPWKSWLAWDEEYSTIVREVQEITAAHQGRRCNDRK